MFCRLVQWKKKTVAGICLVALGDRREMRHHRASARARPEKNTAIQQCRRRWYSDPAKCAPVQIAITRRCRMRFNSIQCVVPFFLSVFFTFIFRWFLFFRAESLPSTHISQPKYAFRKMKKWLGHIIYWVLFWWIDGLPSPSLASPNAAVDIAHAN